MSADIEKGYDVTSVDQAQGTIDSLKHNPAEVRILDMFSAKLAGSSGLLCDLGCGPGQISKYFSDRGVTTVGVDLSAGMLKQARLFHPTLRFVKADMKKLPFKDGELAAVGGFSLCATYPDGKFLEF